MTKEKKPKGYWTPSRCAIAAMQCQSRSEFYTRFPSAYMSARKGGYLADICASMCPSRSKRKPRHVMYTRSYCKKLASQFSTTKSFRESEPSAYNKIVTNGWHDCLSHLTQAHRQWTEEKALSTALSCKDYRTFTQNHPGAYRFLMRHNHIDRLKALFRARKLPDAA
jgi:hypothetical protein